MTTDQRAMELTKDVFFNHPPENVWAALTDKYAVAEWLMPNNFEPVVGHNVNFHVDKMPFTGFTGVSECEVLEIDPPRKLVYTWVSVHATKGRHPPMTLSWTLEAVDGGTRLTLHQTGLEALNKWWRFSMTHGWGRMMKTLLPKVLQRVEDGRFTPGAIKRRDYGTKTVPAGYAK
jgi:uncharacterized protein YndB with AHSA1/START domain